MKLSPSGRSFDSNSKKKKTGKHGPGSEIKTSNHVMEAWTMKKTKYLANDDRRRVTPGRDLEPLRQLEHGPVNLSLLLVLGILIATLAAKTVVAQQVQLRGDERVVFGMVVLLVSVAMVSVVGVMMLVLLLLLLPVEWKRILLEEGHVLVQLVDDGGRRGGVVVVS